MRGASLGFKDMYGWKYTATATLKQENVWVCLKIRYRIQSHVLMIDNEIWFTVFQIAIKW